MNHKEAGLTLLLLGAIKKPTSIYHTMYTLKNGSEVFLCKKDNNRSFIHYNRTKNSSYMSHKDILDQVREDLCHKN
jgi:hypothetical protein